MIRLPLSNSYLAGPDGSSEGSAARSATVHKRRRGGNAGGSVGVKIADITTPQFFGANGPKINSFLFKSNQIFPVRPEELRDTGIKKEELRKLLLQFLNF